MTKPSNISSTVDRRSVLAMLGVSIVGGLGTAGNVAHAQSGKPDLLRIGYQKSSTLIAVLKAQGNFEKQLAAQNVKVTWHEFASGLPLIEALNLDNLDLSADVADTVPVFAQAAGAKLTFVAQESPSPSAQAIVVKADSPIRSVADLKGKKVGFAKAAGAHYLLIAALGKSGLTFKDIEPAYLTPADGRAAFEKGAIDAWVVWDPFLAAVQRQSSVRVIADGSNDLASYQRYYLAATSFAKKRPEILSLVFNELHKTGTWVKRNPDDAAALLAPIWGLDAPTVLAANARRSYEVRAVTRSNLGEQQRIADAFFGEKLLPAKIDALDAPLFAPTVAPVRS